LSPPPSGSAPPTAHYVITSEEARAELTELLAGVHKGLRDLSKIISATQLSVPGEMQPLWGPERCRTVP
jgi:uncharacterized alpha-E superfamily protein